MKRFLRLTDRRELKEILVHVDRFQYLIRPHPKMDFAELWLGTGKDLSKIDPVESYSELSARLEEATSP